MDLVAQNMVDDLIASSAEQIGAAEMERLFTLREDLATANVDPRDHLLDAGCGSSVMSSYLLRSEVIARATLVDVSENYETGQRIFFPEALPTDRTTFKRGNLFSLDPTTSKFDFVICIDVLEHVVQWKSLIQRLWDLTAPNGYLYLQVPSNYSSPNYSLADIFQLNLKQRLHRWVPRLVSYDGSRHVRHGFSCKQLRDFFASIGADILLAREQYTRNPYFSPCGFKPRTSLLARKA